MTMTIYGRYILNILQEVKCMEVKQILWLSKMKYNSTEAQTIRELEILARKKLLKFCNEDRQLIAVPNIKLDCHMIDALAIMLKICGNRLPEFFCGKAPCLLSFYLQDSKGYIDFKIINIKKEQEVITLEKLNSHYGNMKYTALFLLEDQEQMQLIYTEKTAYFVFKNKAGGFDFTKAIKNL